MRTAARAAAQSRAARVHTAAHTCCTSLASEALGLRPKFCRMAGTWAAPAKGLGGQGATLRLKKPRCSLPYFPQSPVAAWEQSILQAPKWRIPWSNPTSLPHSLLHLSHVVQEYASSFQQGRGGTATKEDPELGQVSQHQPHKLPQVQAPNHLLKPAGGKGNWTESFLSPQPTWPHLPVSFSLGSPD